MRRVRVRPIAGIGDTSEDMGMILRIAVLIPLVVGSSACAAESSLVGRWGSSAGPCQPETVATLRADGTYTEAGGQGRWRVIGNKLQLQVLDPPKIAFESLYPELLAHDQDGQIEILSESTLLLRSEGYTKTLHRCS